MMLRANRVLVAAVAIVLCAVAASTAFAQDGGGKKGGRGRAGRGGGMGMMGGMGGQVDMLMLLRVEKVRTALDLTEDQTKKLEELQEKNRTEMREAMAGMGDMSPEERATKMRERVAEVQKEVESILLPQQIERLKEIRLQLAGAGALRDPEVVKELELTEEQQTQLRELFQSMAGRFAPPPRNQDMSQEERREAMTKMMDEMRKTRAELDEKAMAILTPEQREKLEKMKGEKIDIDPAELRAFGRGPGGPGGPGGGNGGARKGRRAPAPAPAE